MHMVLMQALHEGKKMKFGHIALEHMLDAAKKSGKSLTYGCLLTKIFQAFQNKDRERRTKRKWKHL